MEAGWWHSFFDEHSEEELEGYFSRDEIDALLEREGDPQLEHLRSHADAMFVAGALYQINGFLDQLAKEQQVWRGDLASTGNRYREVYKEERLKDLRDVIEHADEHIALHKSAIASDFDAWLGVRIVGKGIGPISIHVFGNEYNAYRAIEAAAEVQKHLEYEIPESMKREGPPPVKDLKEIIG